MKDEGRKWMVGKRSLAVRNDDVGVASVFISDAPLVTDHSQLLN
jgi:hypothetical protein